jgi:hypothetical protein
MTWIEWRTSSGVWRRWEHPWTFSKRYAASLQDWAIHPQPSYGPGSDAEGFRLRGFRTLRQALNWHSHTRLIIHTFSIDRVVGHQSDRGTQSGPPIGITHTGLGLTQPPKEGEARNVSTPAKPRRARLVAFQNVRGPSAKSSDLSLRVADDSEFGQTGHYKRVRTKLSQAHRLGLV